YLKGILMKCPHRILGLKYLAQALWIRREVSALCFLCERMAVVSGLTGREGWQGTDLAREQVGDVGYQSLGIIGDAIERGMSGIGGAGGSGSGLSQNPGIVTRDGMKWWIGGEEKIIGSVYIKEKHQSQHSKTKGSKKETGSYGQYGVVQDTIGIGGGYNSTVVPSTIILSSNIAACPLVSINDHAVTCAMFLSCGMSKHTTSPADVTNLFELATLQEPFCAFTNYLHGMHCLDQLDDRSATILARAALSISPFSPSALLLHAHAMRLLEKNYDASKSAQAAANTSGLSPVVCVAAAQICRRVGAVEQAIQILTACELTLKTTYGEAFGSDGSTGPSISRITHHTSGTTAVTVTSRQFSLSAASKSQSSPLRTVLALVQCELCICLIKSGSSKEMDARLKARECVKNAGDELVSVPTWPLILYIARENEGESGSSKSEEESHYQHLSFSGAPSTIPAPRMRTRGGWEEGMREDYNKMRGVDAGRIAAVLDVKEVMDIVSSPLMKGWIG
ncbi:hypothetical protein ADUPG1_006673, partial [Aduncisulcus paluster]